MQKTKRQLHRRHQQPQQHSLHHHHHQPRYASDDSASAASPAARPDVVVDWSVSQPVCPSRSEWTLLRAARDIYDIEVEVSTLLFYTAAWRSLSVDVSNSQACCDLATKVNCWAAIGLNVIPLNEKNKVTRPLQIMFAL